MEFFLDNQNIEEQYQEILKEMFLLKNGEVHQEMKEFGLEYKKALGASIISLRHLAARYEANHLLAQKLWSGEYRETRILATLLEEPDKVSTEQMKRWMEEMESPEMIEQASMNLFSRMPKGLELAIEWIGHGEEKYRWAALLIAGRIAMMSKEGDEEAFLQFLERIPQEVGTGYYLKVLCRNLGKVARISEMVRCRIISMLEERQATNANWGAVAQELEFELGL